MKCFNCQQEGHMAWQCSWEAELTAAPATMPAQYIRCSCGKIVYAWDKGIPCDKHRTVAGWQEYYRSPQFAADVREARERVEDSRDEFRRVHGLPLRTEEDLRSIAARQVAESRAKRTVLP